MTIAWMAGTWMTGVLTNAGVHTTTEVDWTALGLHLRRERQKCGISAADIARGLYIREGFVLALEDGNISTLPGEVYALGFARRYAEYIGIDIGQWLQLATVQQRLNRTEVTTPPIATALLFGLLCASLMYYVLSLNFHAQRHKPEAQTRLPALQIIRPVPPALASVVPLPDIACYDYTGGRICTLPAPWMLQRVPQASIMHLLTPMLMRYKEL